MIVQEIAITDFLSFENARITLPSAGLVLVTGWDEDLQRANGAGKSSMFQALCWCIYGELPRDISKAELIRRGQKQCSVWVKLDIEGVSYEVTRWHPSSFELKVAGVVQKGNPKFLQALLVQAIGLEYDQFLITSYFPQKGDSSRFLKQADKAAKDFLATILNFNKTEVAYKKIHQELKDLESLVLSKKTEVLSIEQSIVRFDAIAKMPAPEKPSIDDAKALKVELDVVELLLKVPPDTNKLDQSITMLKTHQQTLQQKRYQLQSIESGIRDLERKVQHLQTAEHSHLVCPSCSADLLDDGGKLVEFDEGAAEAVRQQKIADANDKIRSKKDDLAKIAPELATEAKVAAKIEELTSKRHSVRHDYDMAAERKKTIVAKARAYKSALDAYTQASEQKLAVAGQMAEMRKSLAEKTTSLASSEQDLAVLAASKAVLSPTGAIAYSLDSVLNDINDDVGGYLDIFSHGTMSYRVSSGEDKAKLAHHLTKDGEEVSVGSLSGGEERGLILSVDLGLSDVIAKKNGVSLPSVLMLDECFEGLDYVGKEKVIDALREVAQNRCIIVIDHGTEFSALFDQSYKITKKNKISTVVAL